MDGTPFPEIAPMNLPPAATWPSAAFDRRRGGGARPASHASPSPRPWPASKLIFLILLHAPLAMAMKWSPYVGTLHAAITLAVGLREVTRSRTPEGAALRDGLHHCQRAAVAIHPRGHLL